MAGTKVKSTKRQAMMAAMPRDPATGRLLPRPKADTTAPTAEPAAAAPGEVADVAAPFPGTRPGDAPEIRVADLGESDPVPPELAGELDGAPDAWAELAAEQEPDWVPWVVDHLVPVVRAPFELAALRLGAHWRVTDEEVRPIVAAVVPAIPRTNITERLVTASPLLAAALHLADLVRSRLAVTRLLQQARREEAKRGAAVQPGSAGGGPGDARGGVRLEDHPASDVPGARADGAVAGTGPSDATLRRYYGPPGAA